ncbi:MAE_28990/MAE_18760 family HEPN-like nuclease [Saccharomonospora piscinae]|uniref:MAE_28990/MAE_18760 family HEPN-like nuclease n=1 Tax=Saccharomonospora piscinae TaxID=687388 RepID=UPI0015937B05|nr:MAE_28990/MAE_18760 family HEPN-like nuclease [Saccharomonospora piscinae]
MSTPDSLEDQLNQDRAWRRTELQSLLAQIRSSTGPAERCLCRAGVALLYAHWEGYTKLALSRYLKYVARRKLLVQELNVCFVARALDESTKKIQGKSSLTISMEKVAWVLENQTARPFIPSNEEIDTRSNLSFDVCKDLFASLGLDMGVLETKKMLIDYSLLAKRNKVAHGEHLEVSRSSYVELHDEVLQMIESVQRVIMTAVDNKHYRRTPCG